MRSDAQKGRFPRVIQVLDLTTRELKNPHVANRTQETSLLTPPLALLRRSALTRITLISDLVYSSALLLLYSTRRLGPTYKALFAKIYGRLAQGLRTVFILSA